MNKSESDGDDDDGCGGHCFLFQCLCTLIFLLAFFLHSSYSYCYCHFYFIVMVVLAFVTMSIIDIMAFIRSSGGRDSFRASLVVIGPDIIIFTIGTGNYWYRSVGTIGSALILLVPIIITRSGNDIATINLIIFGIVITGIVIMSVAVTIVFI